MKQVDIDKENLNHGQGKGFVQRRSSVTPARLQRKDVRDALGFEEENGEEKIVIFERSTKIQREF